MFIDSHCHLDFDVFDKTRTRLLQSCIRQNIAHIINPSVDFASWQRVLAASKKYPEIIPALGLHPLFCHHHRRQHLDALAGAVKVHNVKIIGEIGLDKRKTEDYQTQLKYFSMQMDIAKVLQKPVIIHAVKSHQEIIAILKQCDFDGGGFIHAFNASYELAREYCKLGFKLGIGSLLHYPKSRLRERIKQIGVDHLVLESDAPDMPIPACQNKINTPLSVVKTFHLMAKLLDLSDHCLEEILYHNTLSVIS